MSEETQIGDIVETTNKTGKYIAEVIDFSSSKALVKVLAVLRHPTQGDLHYPGVAENVMFQQRRAMAFNEKTWVHPKSLKPYNQTIPPYNDSLQKALSEEIEKLEQQNDQWAKRSVEHLKILEHDYFK